MPTGQTAMLARSATAARRQGRPQDGEERIARIQQELSDCCGQNDARGSTLLVRPVMFDSGLPSAASFRGAIMLPWSAR